MTRMIPDEDPRREMIRWESCTWEGARLAQLKAYRKLSFTEKLRAIESWCEFSRFLIERRKKRGLPVIPLHGHDREES